MKCNVIFCPAHIEELYFTGKTIVMIDVLRASNTIITALNNGAREIVPVGSVEFAVKVSGGMFGGQTLIGGERNTRKIDGFALGNSPLEYTGDIVAGKSIIFFTTNGSKAVVKAKFSENLFVCSFANLTAVAKHIISLDQDFEILCAGKNHSFSLEDAVCAGALISKIQVLKGKLELNDTANASVVLKKSFGKSTLNMLKSTEHGRVLMENQFEEDIKHCSHIDNVKVIPFFSENVLKLMPDQDSSSHKKKK